MTRAIRASGGSREVRGNNKGRINGTSSNGGRAASMDRGKGRISGGNNKGRINGTSSNRGRAASMDRGRTRGSGASSKEDSTIKGNTARGRINGTSSNRGRAASMDRGRGRISGGSSKDRGRDRTRVRSVKQASSRNSRLTRLLINSLTKFLAAHSIRSRPRMSRRVQSMLWRRKPKSDWATWEDSAACLAASRAIREISKPLIFTYSVYHCRHLRL